MKNQPKLSHVTLMLTYDCNMSCYMCGQVYSKRRNKEYSRLPLKVIKREINQCQDIESVYLFGGEPLLYPEFDELVEYLHQKGIMILMTTNGLLLDKYVESIVKYVTDVSVSIDSYRKADYEKIRSLHAFETVMNNFKILANEKKRTNSNVKVGLNIVAIKENCNYLQEIYDYFYYNFEEVDRINFEAPIIINQKIGNEYEKICKERFFVCADTWKWFCNRIEPFTKEELSKMDQAFRKLRVLPKTTFLSPKDDDMLVSFLENKELFSYPTCKFMYHSCSILPNGDVTFCVDFPDYLIGNINNTSLLSLFYNDTATKFRTYFEKQGNLPICQRCPRIFNKDNAIK